MGCGGSKVDDLPLVNLCRERKEFIKAAAGNRYALAASHVSYFRSLKGVSEALSRFVDEELVIGLSSPPPDSPVLTLPSDEGKKKKKQSSSRNTNNPNTNNNSSSLGSSSNSTSLSHSGSASLSHHHSSPPPHVHSPDNDSHLHLASSSDTTDSGSGHIHIHEDDDDEPKGQPYSSHIHHHEDEPDIRPYYSPPQEMNWGPYNGYPEPDWGPNNGDWGPNNGYYHSYYMKKSSTAIPTVVYEEPRPAQMADSSTTSYTANYAQYGGGVGRSYGAPMGTDSNSPPRYPYYDPYRDPYNNRPQSPPAPPAAPPSPPSPPRYSAWEFLNPFESVDNGYPGYYSSTRFGIRSVASSPDSMEVRQREGIPDLEEETEQEMAKEVNKGKQKVVEENVRRDSGEGTSRRIPMKSEEKMRPVEEKEIKSMSSESMESKGPEEEEVMAKKGVSFEVEEQSMQDGDSSLPSSLTTISIEGNRDLQEAVKEIRDEFEIASDHGKEVALMLEVGKLPYNHRSTLFKVISSRILNVIAPSTLTASHPPSRRSQHAVASVMKLAKDKYGDFEDFERQSGNLSSTLERLYAWEKKLYKEVKDEERLRAIYEKKCKRLKILDVRGAETQKIDATQASIKKLLTRINITLKTVEAIASRIHKLRDEELQPRITELINGLIRMWKSMLKCHQKQFQAIIESKSRALMANTGVRRGSSLRATVELEMQLLNWCTHFNNWINTQKAYVESLNEWLQRCLLQEPEETPDGLMPFSPGRAGAPPVFVICGDWYHAMERHSETEVANTMHAFALNLHRLWERQDEEQRQRLKAEYLFKDFEKRLRSLRKEEVKMHRERDASSDKSTVSVVPTDSGVSPLADLKVDLDSMRKRLEEEKARHKETIKQVHEAASNSLQAGLAPIFEALRNFTSETLKAYEHVRIQTTGGGTYSNIT